MRFNNFLCYHPIVLSRKFLRSLWHSRRNVRADAAGGTPPAGPYMAEFDITYRCNCRCRMCQRWNDPRSETMTTDHYRRLAREFDELAVHQISIAGGEPLMRKDVFEIIRGFADRGQSVNLCTNGLLVDHNLNRIIDSGATCVTVSLDGATARSHDAIRGIAGSYEAIARGIRRMVAVPRGKRPLVRVRMTISALNQSEIQAFYQNWAGLADDVLLQPVHHCGDSYYTGMRQSELDLDPDTLAAQVAGTPLGGDGYLKTFIESLRSSAHYPDLVCFAGVLMARIDPWGNVYPCLEQHTRVGSVIDRSFKDVWRSHRFDRERRRLRTERTCRCWYNNTALIGHYGSLLQKTLAFSKGRVPADQGCAAVQGSPACGTTRKNR